MFSIGEISKRTKVTTRTLRYYDEIDLLNPSHISESGYRYYTTEDIMKLQQITMFKKLGFKLSEIRKMLQQEDGFSKEERWKQAIHTEIQTIQAEIERLRSLEKLLYTAAHSMELQGDLRAEDILLFIQSVQGHDAREQFRQKHFTKAEQEIVKSLPSLEEEDSRTKKWFQLLREIRQHIHEPIDTPVIQGLAERMIEFSMDVFQGNEELIDKYWGLIKPEEEEEAKVYGLDREMMDYIEKIVEHYIEKGGR